MSISRSPIASECKLAGKPAAALDYASLEDFYAERDHFASETKCPWQHSGMWKALRRNDAENARFFGAAVPDIVARRWGWPDGVAELERLPVPEVGACGGTWRRVWSEDDGDEWDEERALDELPMLRRRVRAAYNRTAARYCTIVVNVGELADKKWRDMLYKAFAAARVADEYEAAGIRCKIVVISPFRHDDVCGRISIVVKRHGEPLNVALLLNVTSPWFFRGEIITHRVNVFDLRGHAGYTLCLCDDDVLEGIIDAGETTILLETKSVLSYESACNWIQTNAAWNENQ